MDNIIVETNYMGIIYTYTITSNGDCMSTHNNKWLCNLLVSHTTRDMNKGLVDILEREYIKYFKKNA